MSEEGYIYWQRGNLWFSRCQLRDNILFASNLPSRADTQVVQMVADTPSEVWKLEVLCPCADGAAERCQEGCLGHTVRAVGIGMTLGGGVGVASAHSSALADSWCPWKGLPRNILLAFLQVASRLHCHGHTSGPPKLSLPWHGPRSQCLATTTV